MPPDEGVFGTADDPPGLNSVAVGRSVNSFALGFSFVAGLSVADGVGFSGAGEADLAATSVTAAGVEAAGVDAGAAVVTGEGFVGTVAGDADVVVGEGAAAAAAGVVRAVVAGVTTGDSC